MRLENLQYIFESVDPNTQDPYFENWQREIHPILMEVALSPEQIKDLFGNVEKAAIASGKSRTAIGYGVDAAGELSKQVKDVWFNKLGGALKNSEPVKNFDAKWEDIKAKFAAKYPDIADKLSGYGEFAKEHPVSQKFLLGIAGSIAAAVGIAAVGGAAAGVAATGMGVGAAMGIVNIADRLLKGENLSTAVGRGATAGLVGGLTAAAVAKFADVIQSTLSNMQQGAKAHTIWHRDSSGYQGQFYLLPKDGQQYDQFAREALKAQSQGFGSANAMFDAGSATNKILKSSSEGMSAIVQKAMDPEYQKAAIAAAQSAGEKVASLQSAIQAAQSLEKVITPVASAAAGQAAGAAGETKESYYQQTRPLSEGQVYMLFNRVCQRQKIMEAGIMDKLKAGAGKVAGAVAKGAQWVGKQATEEITSAKLLANWKMSGSPTDSEALKKFLIDSGVDAGIVDQVYADMKIGTTDTSDIESQITADIEKVTPQEREQLLKYLQTQLGTA